jgi:hypothetical protein
MRSRPERLTVRFTPEEFRSIVHEAKTQGQTPAGWVRSQCLKQVEPGPGESHWGKLWAEHLVTQKLLEQLVQEFVAYASNGDRSSAISRMRAIFEKAEACRDKKSNGGQ